MTQEAATATAATPVTTEERARFDRDGYLVIRDHNDPVWASGWAGRLNPVQRQLLGGVAAGDGDHAWGHYPGRTPLYEWLSERGLLDPANPPLKP